MQYCSLKTLQASLNTPDSLEASLEAPELVLAVPFAVVGVFSPICALAKTAINVQISKSNVRKCVLHEPMETNNFRFDLL